MALPKLKLQHHELELPSTGEKIKFRPFLVKEQKLVMRQLKLTKMLCVIIAT